MTITKEQQLKNIETIKNAGLEGFEVDYCTLVGNGDYEIVKREDNKIISFSFHNCYAFKGENEDTMKLVKKVHEVEQEGEYTLARFTKSENIAFIPKKRKTLKLLCNEVIKAGVLK